MNVKQQVEKALATIREHAPKTAQEFRKLGFRLKQIGEGAFRVCYSINALPLVIKIPKSYSSSGYREGRSHAIDEYKAWRRINRFKKYIILKEYMPKIHYFDSKTGITVMQKYQLLGEGSTNGTEENVRRLLEKLFVYVYGGTSWGWRDYGDADLDNPDNVGLDEGGNIVLLDLGLLDEKHSYV